MHCCTTCSSSHVPKTTRITADGKPRAGIRNCWRPASPSWATRQSPSPGTSRFARPGHTSSSSSRRSSAKIRTLPTTSRPGSSPRTRSSPSWGETTTVPWLWQRTLRRSTYAMRSGTGDRALNLSNSSSSRHSSGHGRRPASRAPHTQPAQTCRDPTQGHGCASASRCRKTPTRRCFTAPYPRSPAAAPGRASDAPLLPLNRFHRRGAGSQRCNRRIGRCRPGRRVTWATGAGIPRAVSSSRNRRAMVASTRTLSSSAKEAPTQARRPPPNGMNE
jgi:hypothetical protein